MAGMAGDDDNTPEPLVCVRCGRVVGAMAELGADHHEGMHQVCFHYELEHGDVDPDRPCASRSCPSRSLLGSTPTGQKSPTELQWEEDSRLLGRIGSVFAAELPEVDVTIPAGLAAAAVRAWDREDEDDSYVPRSEPTTQRELRHRAAVLAFIGLALEERGRPVAGDVRVRLRAELIGTAVDVADEQQS